MSLDIWSEAFSELSNVGSALSGQSSDGSSSSSSGANPLRPCILGELAGAGTASLVLGSFGGIVGGEQSAMQVALQALGSSGGAYVMTSTIGCPLLPHHSTGAATGRKAGPRDLGIRLVGASIGALLAWLAFPKGLDFALVASSVVTSVGAVVATIATQPDHFQTPGPIHGKGTQKKHHAPVASVMMGEGTAAAASLVQP